MRVSQLKMNLVYIVLLICLCCFSFSSALPYDADGEDFMTKREEATEFYKRLFHFGTKNEEIKRETREVYEEKCESIVPTKR